MQKGKCNHLRYVDLLHPKCDLGHDCSSLARDHTLEEATWHNKNYPEFPLSGSALSRRIPCNAENNVFCPDFQEPTPDELEDYEQKTTRQAAIFLEQMFQVRPAIVEYIKQKDMKDKDFRDTIPCPICETGIVSFTYAGSFNKHIHAICNTTDCVSWIE